MFDFFVIFIIVTKIGQVSLEFESFECPKRNGSLVPLGKTRFAIIQDTERGGFSTHEEAKTECQKYGLVLANIENINQMDLIARTLEKVAFKERYRDTWYWIEGAYDYDEQVYKDSYGQNIKYHNFFYRPPRPIDIGKHVNYKRQYEPNRHLPQCLALALPWPWPKSENSSKIVFGNQASIEERYCESKTSRHVLCQVPGTLCNAFNSDFSISESNLDYFHEGSWVFGDRKYILDWQPRSMEESVDHCTNLKLQLFTPGKEEKYLIPHLKMWSRSITQAQFWTNLMYNAKTQEFLDKDGKVVAIQSMVNWTDKDTLRSRRSDDNNIYCVVMSLSYEFKGQMPCIDVSNPACSWSFIHYVPANCQNNHGTICQHKDHAKRNITWDKINFDNLTDVLRDSTITREFGFKGNTQILRSKVKQLFGNVYCPEGYYMMTQEDVEKHDLNYYPEYLPEDDVYHYDFKETYMLLAEHGYNKLPDQFIYVSSVNNDNQRYILSSQSHKWHFYLCSKHRRPVFPRVETQIWPQITMQWKEGPQPRYHPHVAGPDYFDVEAGERSALNWRMYPKGNGSFYLIGQLLENTTRALVSFVDDTAPDSVQDKFLHLDFKVPKYVGINSYINQTWGKEQTNGSFPFRLGYTFEMKILCVDDLLLFYVDGKYFNTFKPRAKYTKLRIRTYGGIYIAYYSFWQDDLYTS